MKTMKDLKFFSKEWRQNYWFYYKWHTIISIVAVVLIVSSIISSINQVKPDIHILFCGDFTLTDTDRRILEERVKDTITDINGDGIVSVNFLEYHLKLDAEHLNETTAATNSMMKTQFITGEQHIYVLDRELYRMYLAQELMDPDTLMEETATNPLFEGTTLVNKDVVMATRVKRADYESDFTTSQQVIDRWATK